MAEEKFGDDSLAARIVALQQRIELLEAGKLGTRERVVRDNRPVLIDTTRQTIDRNKQWMGDLRALEARAVEAAAGGGKGKSPGKQIGKQTGKRAAVN